MAPDPRIGSASLSPAHPTTGPPHIWADLSPACCMLLLCGRTFPDPDGPSDLTLIRARFAEGWLLLQQFGKSDGYFGSTEGLVCPTCTVVGGERSRIWTQFSRPDPTQPRPIPPEPSLAPPEPTRSCLVSFVPLDPSPIIPTLTRRQEVLPARPDASRRRHAMRWRRPSCLRSLRQPTNAAVRKHVHV